VDLTTIQPQKAPVMIGDHVLSMRVPSMSVATEMLKILSAVDLERLIDPTSEMFARFTEDEDDIKVSVLDVVTAIKDLGPKLIPIAREVVGHQFVPAMLAAAIACLDTRRTFKALAGAEVVSGSAAIDTDEDGAFLGCPEVRALIKEDMTVSQAVHVVMEAVQMADIFGSVGKVIGALMPGSNDETTPAMTPK